MTERVDFYVLKSSTETHRLTFACRLAEKAYLRDLKVLMLSDSMAEVATLDQLLWTFNERSFVPHEVCTAGPGTAAAGTAPVLLTPEVEGAVPMDLLVNLSARLPAGFERFGRIAEVIDADEERRRLGRERFKAYRDLKIPVETHQLDDANGV